MLSMGKTCLLLRLKAASKHGESSTHYENSKLTTARDASRLAIALKKA